MTTAAVSPHTTDLPIVVQDRRRRGFYTIDNEVIDGYGLMLKAHGIAVYSVLARFANRDGECFPSQATIAKRLDMSRMQVIREIEKLKTLGLIEVKPQFGSRGEQRSNLYILCDVPKVEQPVKHRYTPSNGELYPLVSGSDTHCNRQLPKQNKSKKLQTEQDLKQPVVVALGSDSPELLNEQGIETAETIRKFHDDNGLSAALLARGLAKPVVQQLMQQYSQAYLEEKLAYLTYWQDTEPEKVMKPCGWLRKAIEDDYAAPDGYGYSEARTDEIVATQNVEEVLQQEYDAQQQRKDEAQARQAQIAEQRLAIQATYGTTEHEVSIWAQILDEFRLTLPVTLFTRYFADTMLLSLQSGEACIGLPDKYGFDWLANRFGKKLEQAFASRLAGQPYTVKFVDLSLLSTHQAVA